MDIHASKLHFIHFVGIKGVAMTALAVYCKERGIAVTGSDVPEDFPTKQILAHAGIIPLEGFSVDHIDTQVRPDLVIYTGAHQGRDNIEVKKAVAAGIPTLPHGKALGMIMEDSVQISVAGSHGKTTTSAMIATILVEAGKDPSYAIGCGTIFPIGAPGHFGKGNEFVAEADEYVTDPGHDMTPRFLWQQPDILVVTNIDFDHPDAYENLKGVEDAFAKFSDKEKGMRMTIINADDPNSRSLQTYAKGEVFTYGVSRSADLQILDIQYGEGSTMFHLSLRGTPVGEPMTLVIPGKHNVYNACAAISACHALGISWKHIQKGLSQFKGTKRRFEHLGTIHGMDFYDDYAHHPHEIEATLEGVRGWYPRRRVIAVFQPHTYSRTKALLLQFGKSFTHASVVCIADIYASARETETFGMTSKRVVEEIVKYKKDVWYVKDERGSQQFLEKHGRPLDIIIFMGAGDIYDWGKKIVKNL